MAAKKIRSVTAKKEAASSNGAINAWPDDPSSGLLMFQAPVPDLMAGPLKFHINGTQYPAQTYDPGTDEFRFWNAAVALRRGGDFWAPLLNVPQWQPGAVLPVGLDEGEDLNAYYDREHLAFFHELVGETTYYSGESPDVLCHEMGHACLDAHRPELWGAPFIEVGSFHESFADISAILSQLQLPSVRAAALAGLRDDVASPLSRLAEQLGFAIRQVSPTSVDADCLRNAYNSFTYIDPQTLPNSAPATQICAEIHSFSRVFTGAVYDILSGMLKIRSSNPTDADLQQVANDFAVLLLTATAAAPVQPDYYAQVAAHIIDADSANGGTYRSALTDTFVKRQIVPQSAVTGLARVNPKVPLKSAFSMSVSAERPVLSHVYRIKLSGDEFGLGPQTLTVRAPAERKPFVMVAASLYHDRTEPDAVERATGRFVRMLFANDRVDRTSRVAKIAKDSPRKQLRKTHVLIDTPDGPELVRRLFHCGCGVG